MVYHEYISLFHDRVNLNEDEIPVGDRFILRNYTFSSSNVFLLPGESNYCCTLHDYHATDKGVWFTGIGSPGSILDIHDARIKENQVFRYHILSPAGQETVNDFILLVHGFNEKTWKKYWPWAAYLCEVTGKSVILFPIAFHMNRAPVVWSDNHAMHNLSELRKADFPDIVGCTMSNVAISTRLHQKPQRFFWSGLQTYYDIIQLLSMVKNGKHPLIDSGARYDLFAYSIGGLLAQVMMMTDYSGYFAKSRLCLFCGGNVFNRFTPVSRYIIDSEANVALYSFIIEHLSNHLRKDDWLNHFLTPLHPEGLNFNAMLNYNKLIAERESALGRVGTRLMAIALEKDRVAPPFEILATLKGINRNIPTDVVLEDMEYEYIHENPFPSNPDLRGPVNDAFQRIFGKIASFLNT